MNSVPITKGAWGSRPRTFAGRGPQGGQIPLTAAPQPNGAPRSGCRLPLQRVEKTTQFAPDPWIPIRFIGFGLLSLGAVALWVAFRPEILVQYHYSPQMAALAHGVVLGFLMSVVMGTLSQMVPVAVGQRLHSPRLAHCQLGAHVLGTIGMCLGFWNESMRWMGLSGALAATAIALMIYNVLRTVRSSKHRNLFTFGLRSALLWIAVTSGLGLYLAAGKIWLGLYRLDPVAQMHAHVHSGVLGGFLILTASVSFRVIPAFTLGAVERPRRAWWSLMLLNIGVGVLIPSIALGSKLRLLGAALVTIGFGLFGCEVRAILGTGRRKRFDWGLRALFIGLSLLGPLCVMGLILSWPNLNPEPIWIQLENVYGLTALLGAAGLAVLGMLYKILPFLIWFHTYSPLVDRPDLPRVQDLYSARVQASGIVLYLVGLVVALVGVLLSHEALAAWGWRGFAAGVLLNLVNFGMMARHLVGPRFLPKATEHSGTQPVPAT